VGLRFVVRVVVGEAVRDHDDLSHARIVGQGHGHGRRLALGVAASVEDEADGFGMGRAGRQGLGDRRVQLAGSVLIEQAQQVVDGTFEVALSLGQSRQQRLGSGY
jgi:hypothetical protein